MELKIHFYLYIKRGFWVVLLDFDLAVFIELENCEVCVCALLCERVFVLE